MIVHSINPVLINLGPVAIRYYGLVYFIGFLFLLLSLKKYAVKHVKGLTSENSEEFVIYLIIGIIVGARAFEVLVYHPLFYLSNPARILMIWNGGLSFHGGLVGAVAAGILFCRRRKISFYELADIVITPVCLFLALGRIANFINAENIGIVASVSWCVVFPAAEGCRHPVQLYEALKNLFIMGVLMLLYKNRKRLKLAEGSIFWLFWILYGTLRFIITFLREDARFLGLSIGQYLCVLMVIMGTIGLLTRYGSAKEGKKRAKKQH